MSGYSGNTEVTATAIGGQYGGVTAHAQATSSTRGLSAPASASGVSAVDPQACGFRSDPGPGLLQCPEA